MALSLLFDIGGTNMRLAASRDGASFAEPKVAATPKTFEEGMATLQRLGVEIAHGEKIGAVAGGLAGSFDRKKSILTGGANIAGWLRKPLKAELERIFGGAEVFLENDAALAGLGEAVEGAGKGKEIVAYLTVGTGVGGARIVNGKIDPSVLGFEPGYQIVDADGTLCPSCGSPHLSAHISGRAIRERVGKEPQEVTDPEVKEELARSLALGLNNMIVFWSPDIVILGGGVMQLIPIDRVRAHLKTLLTRFPALPPIEPAALGDKSGLWGALIYLNQMRGV